MLKFREFFTIAKKAKFRTPEIKYYVAQVLKQKDLWNCERSHFKSSIAEHHLKTKHQIDWDSARCITYSTAYFQRLTLESWFTNLDQTPLNRGQQLPAP